MKTLKHSLILLFGVVLLAAGLYGLAEVSYYTILWAITATGVSTTPTKVVNIGLIAITVPMFLAWFVVVVRDMNKSIGE